MHRRVTGSDRDALAVEGCDQTIAREVDDHPIEVSNDLGKLLGSTGNPSADGK